ncbi:MAG: hypothetical protein ACE5HI_14680, partial [bacterium]
MWVQQDIIQDTAVVQQTVLSVPIREEGALIKTETAVCNNEKYVFDTIFIKEKGYFNDIYKTKRAKDNFVMRLKSPRGGNLGFFSILSVPQKECDRMYLTTVIGETDAPKKGIFVWDINEKV